MIIDTTEVQAISSFSRLESLKEVYGIIWVLIPIFTPVLGITIGVLVIVWLGNAFIELTGERFIISMGLNPELL